MNETEKRSIEMDRTEAHTAQWALTYVAQALGEKHLRALLEDEGLSDSEFGERAERLLHIADRIESEFGFPAFE